MTSFIDDIFQTEQGGKVEDYMDIDTVKELYSKRYKTRRNVRKCIEVQDYLQNCAENQSLKDVCCFLFVEFGLKES